MEEIQFAPVPLPADLDNGAPVEVHLMVGKDANANTVVIAVGAFFGVGDTKCGGNTAAIRRPSAKTKVALAAADVAAPPEASST